MKQDPDFADLLICWLTAREIRADEGLSRILTMLNGKEHCQANVPCDHYTPAWRVVPEEIVR